MPKDFKEFDEDMNRRLRKLQKAHDDELPEAIGQNLVDGFRMSFRRQRFNDYGSQPWQEVKRRKKGSGWYGFEYKGEKKRDTIGLRSKRKPNFSRAATTRNILIGHGRTGLLHSIFLKKAKAGLIEVATDKEYAEVHNEGGKIKVFGKYTTTVPQRQFMGHSKKIEDENFNIINERINKIFRK